MHRHDSFYDSRPRLATRLGFDPPPPASPIKLELLMGKVPEIAE
jgi:hypothetical protein